MRKAILLLPALLAMSSCADRQIGERYLAERDYWRTNWDSKNLSVRPREIGDEQWASLAARYEGIADRCERASHSAEATTRRELQILGARSLFAAAQVYGGRGDSVRVENILSRMSTEFSQIPDIAGEVAAMRAMSAEGKGDVEGAADLYQFVLDRVAPATDATGVAKMVIDLPLRIARLRTRASSSSAGPSYETARRYYEGWMGDPKAEEAIQSMAMERLAQVDADLGQWDRSLNTLRSLEDRLRRLPKPSKDPAEVRMTEYVVQTQAGSDPMIGRETLLSLLRDYPGWKSVPEALIILAGNASDRNEVDEALGYLDRIAEEHKTEEDALTKALLVRARILERHDRWPEALTACRSLQSEHPLSREALSVPLEIVNHYGRKNDTDGMQTALGKATQEYRDFLSQYPPGPLTRVARDHLIQALLLQRQFDLAINEMLTLSDELAGTADGQRMLYQAADLAGRALEDTTRVVAILDHAVELYPSTRFGSWASTEAGRLRETISQ